MKKTKNVSSVYVKELYVNKQHLHELDNKNHKNLENEKIQIFDVTNFHNKKEIKNLSENLFNLKENKTLGIFRNNHYKTNENSKKSTKRVKSAIKNDSNMIIKNENHNNNFVLMNSSKMKNVNRKTNLNSNQIKMNNTISTKNKVNMKTLIENKGIQEMSSTIRFTRPSSSYKDSIFNQYWIETKSLPTIVKNDEKENFKDFNLNELNKNENLNSNLKNTNNNVEEKKRINSAYSNLSLIKSNKKVLKKDYNLNIPLYSYENYNWDEKKDFKFLSNVGGVEINNNPFYNNIDDSLTTYYTQNINSRPISGIEFSTLQTNIDLRPLNSFRPFTGIIRPNNLGSKVNVIYENENKKAEYLKNKNLRPITAVNRPNSSIKEKIVTRPISNSNSNNDNLKSSSNEKKVHFINNEFDELDEILEDSKSMEFDENKNYTKGNKYEYINSKGKLCYKNINNEDDANYLNYHLGGLSKYEVNKNKNRDIPKTEKLVSKYERIDVVKYSIKLQTADTDFLEIFDRSQRTKASTITKVGDYDYYTPCQRIGNFMEYCQHLKLEDIKNIEKHVNYHLNQESYNKNSNFVIDFKDDPDTEKKEGYMKYTNSLFHGFMKYEADIESYYIELGDKNKTFNPIKFIKISFQNIYDIDSYPSDFKKLIVTSLWNYNKYLDSDKIRIEDIEPYNSDVRRKILVLLEPRFFSCFEKQFKLFFYELENQYYLTLKNIIMQYIIRSPFERQRLNIQYFPKKELPTSYIIASHGGFNRLLYHKWVTNYHNSKIHTSQNLLLLGIFGSSLYDWTYNFEHVDLFLFDCKDILEENLNTVNVESYIMNQNLYLNKAFRFLKDIYYRGANLILKKNKRMIKKTLQQSGKWTFKGFVPDSNKKYKSRLISNNSNSPYLLNTETDVKITEEIKFTNNSLYQDVQKEHEFSTTCLENKIKRYNCTSLINEDYLVKCLSEEQQLITHNKIHNLCDINSDIHNQNFQMGLLDELINFDSNITINDFYDIRLNTAYYAFETVILNKKFDLDACLIDNYSKQQISSLNNNAVSFIQIFFRKILEKSLSNLLQLIVSYKTFDEIFKTEEKVTITSKDVDKNIETHKMNIYNSNYEINNFINYSEKDYRFPKLKAFCLNDRLNPLMHIPLIWDKNNNQVKFIMQFEQIVSKFVELIDKALLIFNTIVTPHHLEFQYISQSEYERIQKEHWAKLNEIFSDPNLKSHSDDYFNNYCPNLILKEENVPSYLKSYLKIADKSEEIFVSIKNRIGKTIKLHFIEMEEVLTIFDPIKELYNGSYRESVNFYVLNQKVKKDYNKVKFLLEKGRLIRKYLATIPSFISYSLLAVDMRDIKKELLREDDEIISILMTSLEEEIIELYTNCIERYLGIFKLIDKKLLTPEDVVEMELTKQGIVMENSLILKDYDEAFRIFTFLLQVDNIFTDKCINKILEMMAKHGKFKEEFEE